MNRYPLWKYLLLAVVLVAGSLYALPNLYGNDPAVLISPRSGAPDQALVDRAVEAAKTVAKGEIKAQIVEDRVQLRFSSVGDQTVARDVIDDTLGREYITALNLVSAAPDWLQSFAQPLYLGLDLRGGVHFLMEVDMEAALKTAQQSNLQDMRTWLREEKIRYKGITQREGTISIAFEDAAARDAAQTVLARQYRTLLMTPRDTAEGKAWIDATLSQQSTQDERTAAIQQNITTLRNRVNEIGVAEPVIQRQGPDRIVVQLPGVQDTTRAKELLGATATLEYRLVYGSAADWISASESGKVPPKALMYKRRSDNSPILLDRNVIVTGDQITGASSGIDTQSGEPAVFVNLGGKGAKRMQRVSAANIGEPMAVVFIETRYDRKTLEDGTIEKTKTLVEEVISVATIRDVLSNRFQTTGLHSEEARTLSVLLNAGALKAPVEIVEERTVGPSLGEANIKAGFMACLVGFGLVMLFMGLYYKVFGLIANLALAFNLVLILAVLSFMQATLTLPGIAGIVLTVGMAVDANVLIFERIREELRDGSKVQQAIEAGYDKAFSTIADANITTLIAAVVLFAFGTGAIKGFAVTLSIGIVTSMFTAIMGTRAVVNWRFGGRKLDRLPI